MILHKGERVYWGTPEVIYLEGTITALDEEKQTVTVHIERATVHSAHLIGSEMAFAANGITTLSGESPPGTTDKRSTERQSLPPMSDDEKVQRAAAAAVHPAMKQQIITSMNEILRR
jgi:hypothetical protein